MRFSTSEVLATAGDSGFDAIVVEKALHLVHLLNVLGTPFVGFRANMQAGSGGKHAAPLSRRQARDLFDCQQILGAYDLDRDRLRIAFVVFGGMNRKDWRTVSSDTTLQQRIHAQPLLAWKALNVRRHHGLS